MNCTEKFIKHSERVGARFAEQNAGTGFYSSLIPNFPLTRGLRAIDAMAAAQNQ